MLQALLAHARHSPLSVDPLALVQCLPEGTIPNLKPTLLALLRHAASHEAVAHACLATASRDCGEALAQRHAAQCAGTIVEPANYRES